MWRLNQKALLGFVYRSKAEIELDGKLETSNLSAPPFTALDGQKITLEFDAPEVFEVGRLCKRFENVAGNAGCLWGDNGRHIDRIFARVQLAVSAYR